MILTIITGNPGKQREFTEWMQLAPDIDLTFKEIDIPEIRDPIVEHVARAKALEVFRTYKEPFLVEDTGLFFEGYENFPGTYPKYIFEAIGYEGILKLTEIKNKAHFQSVIAYMDPSLQEPLLFSGFTNGAIVREVDTKAHEGFPYDNIFMAEGMETTNSRLTFDELRENNHRAKSIRAFCEFFNDYAKKFS